MPDRRWHDKWILVKGEFGPNLSLLPINRDAISRLEQISTSDVEVTQAKLLKAAFPKSLAWTLFIEEGVLIKAGLVPAWTFDSSTEPSWGIPVFLCLCFCLYSFFLNILSFSLFSEEVFEAAKGMGDPFQIELRQMAGRRQPLLNRKTKKRKLTPFRPTDSPLLEMSDAIGNVQEKSRDRPATPMRRKPLLKRSRVESPVRTSNSSTSLPCTETIILDAEGEDGGRNEASLDTPEDTFLPQAIDPPMIVEQTLTPPLVDPPNASTSSSNNFIDNRLTYLDAGFSLQPAGLTISSDFSWEPLDVLQALRPLINKQLGESYEDIEEPAMHCGVSLVHALEVCFP